MLLDGVVLKGAFAFTNVDGRDTYIEPVMLAPNAPIDMESMPSGIINELHAVHPAKTLSPIAVIGSVVLDGVAVVGVVTLA